MGFTLSCLQCVKSPAFKLVLRPNFFFLHSLFLFIFRLRVVTSAASQRIVRLPFHLFIFCDILLIFILLFILPICMKKRIFLFVLPKDAILPHHVNKISLPLQIIIFQKVPRCQNIADASCVCNFGKVSNFFLNSSIDIEQDILNTSIDIE